MTHRLSVSLVAVFICIQACGQELAEVYTWDDADVTFNRYCFECHGGFAKDADLDLVNIQHKADLEADPEKWTKILEALRTHYMPHPDGREMPIEDRHKLVAKIRNELRLQATGYEAVSAPLRRLNRTEYSNTLNDLLILDHDWSVSLPADNAGYGFDNIAAALTFSPLLMERYFAIASEAAMMAVPQRMEAKNWSIPASTFTGAIQSGSGKKVLISSGPEHATRHRIYLPGKGRYDLTLQLSAQQAGGENARGELRMNGRTIGQYEVAAGSKGPPNEFAVQVDIAEPGEYTFAIHFLNDYYRENEGRNENRNLIFHGLKLHGPLQAEADWNSAFLERHFGDLPEKLSLQSLRDGIHRFASRAYRRPATQQEVDSLWKVFQANGKPTSNEADLRHGLHAVIDAILTSPAFLFRFEGREDEAPETEYVLASWLSYFLWSSMPDDRLFSLAHRGQLRHKLVDEVARMLEDPRSVALADNFAGQWWHLRDLEIHQPDRSIYENADRALLEDMQEETKRFFQYVLKEDRPLLDFLTADYTFINERLARHYGVSGVEGGNFRKVSLADTPRRGVWAQSGILTATSYPNYTSPVLRGAWILDNLLGLSPPPPPDNIPSLPGTDGNPDPSNLRASLALHRENPDCASCHDIMDPIGLALEHFDAVGGLRSLEERKKLSEETLFDGTVIRDPIDMARYFEEQRSSDFLLNVARKLSIYAAGRGLDWKDEAAIERVASHTRERDFRFSALINGVVNEFAPIAKPYRLSFTVSP